MSIKTYIENLTSSKTEQVDEAKYFFSDSVLKGGKEDIKILKKILNDMKKLSFSIDSKVLKEIKNDIEAYIDSTNVIIKTSSR